MKKFYTLFSALFFTVIYCNAQAPNWAWGKTSTGSPNGYTNRTTTDVNGNVYVAGYFETGPITFGSTTLPLNGLEEAYLVKYDPNGNVLWARGSNTTSQNCYASAGSVVVDNLGNVYLSGTFYIYVNFGSLILTDSTTGDRPFIVKYDSNGNELWAKTGMSTTFAGIDNLGSMCIDVNNNIYLAGSFDDSALVFGGFTFANPYQVYTPSIEQNYIAKMDSNGNILWGHVLLGSQSQYYNVNVDHLGNSYISSGFSISGGVGTNVPIFGNDTLTLTPGNVVVIAKYDSNGNELWAHNYGGDWIDGISFDNANNILAAGYFSNPSIALGTYTLNNASNGDSTDIFIAKLDPNGNVLWAQRNGGINDDDAVSICNDNAGNIYILGNYESPSITMGTDTLDNSHMFYKNFISKYDSNGNIIWTKGAGSYNYNYLLSMVIDANNNLFCFGYISNCTIILGNDILTAVGSTSGKSYLAKLYSTYSNEVWPGDANVNHVVDNNDLLPIGLYYGQAGASRSTVSNAWQSYTCTDWGTNQLNGNDFKHIDCNGDGIIDSNDTLAINLNFNLVHAIPTHHIINEEKINAPALYFVTSSNQYNAGDMVDVEVWAGNSLTPVSNLYGIAFNISYDASLVQSGTESITYPASWLGTSGTNLIKIGKADALAAIAYGAETRINHTNANGFGKIADFKFQANASISSASVLHFSVSNYMANDSAGTPRVFNTINDSILINSSTVGINEYSNNNSVSISPNPFTSQTTISFSSEQRNTSIKITDVLAKEIKTITFSGKQCTIEKGTMQAGIYFVQIENESKGIVNRKIVIQ